MSVYRGSGTGCRATSLGRSPGAKTLVRSKMAMTRLGLGSADADQDVGGLRIGPLLHWEIPAAKRHLWYNRAWNRCAVETPDTRKFVCFALRLKF